MADKIIGFKDAEYARFLGFEDQAKNSVAKIETIAKEALAVQSIENYIELLEDPHGYIVEKFWELYAKDEPAHMDKTVFLNSKVPVNVVELTKHRTAFKSAVKELRHFAPKVTKSGVKSNLKKEDFNIILDPKKQSEFEAVTKFMDAANELKEKYNASGSIHLLRFANGKIRLNNGVAVINPYDYAKR